MPSLCMLSFGNKKEKPNFDKRGDQMKFQGALIREQGIAFAVVVVKKHVVDNRPEADRTIRTFQPVFPGVPVVLMAQDTRGIPTYYGRRDIARFLANTPLRAIPWKEYNLN